MNRSPCPARVAAQAVLASLACLVVSSMHAAAVVKSEAEMQMEFGVKVARMGAWNEAAFRFEKAVQADQSNPRAYNNLAVALESTGRFEEARGAYEKAVALAPDDRRIQANYERFLGLMKSHRKVGHAP